MLVGKVSRIFVKPEPSSSIKHYFNAVLKLYTSSGHSNVLRKCLKKNSSWKRELLIKVEDTFSSRPCAIYFSIGFQLSCQRTWAFSYVNIGSLKHTNPKTISKVYYFCVFQGSKSNILNWDSVWSSYCLSQNTKVALLLPESYLAASALGHVKQTFHHVKQTSGRKLHDNNIGVMGLLHCQQ